MSEQREHDLALVPPPGAIIEGYLDEALPPASRDPDTKEFFAGTAEMSVWAWVPETLPDPPPDPPVYPPAKIWTNLQTKVTLTNTSETRTGEEDAYCKAVWITESWRPEDVSCAASLIPHDWRCANGQPNPGEVCE